jgi:hypothetical protein
VTNLAQRSTVRLKVQLNLAYERIGQQRTELNAQFIRTPVMVEQVGLDNEGELTEIAPYLLQGDYLFDIEPMNESLMRSERRAEANAKFQTFLQRVAGVDPACGFGGGDAAELRRVRGDWLESYDLGDTKRFFSSKAASAGAGGPEPAVAGAA